MTKRKRPVPKKPAKKPRARTRRSAKPGIPAETSDRFVEGLVRRGEAVPVGPGEELPSGATHEIVATNETGQPVVKRRRFTIA